MSPVTCNCFGVYEQRTLYGALVVTLAMLLHLINGRAIIYYYNISKHTQSYHY